MTLWVWTKFYLPPNMEWVNRITGFVANPFPSEVLRWCVSQEVLDNLLFSFLLFQNWKLFYGKCYSQLLHLYLLETPTDFVCIKVAFIMFHFMYFTILFVINTCSDVAHKVFFGIKIFDTIYLNTLWFIVIQTTLIMYIKTFVILEPFYLFLILDFLFSIFNKI